MRKKRGFTLVELLVVIAIIALLMSILMPALGRAKLQANDVICKSNLKQWGSVFSMYANDNSSYFMTGWMGFTVTEHTDQWPSALRPYYANNGDLRLCPSARKPVSEGNPGAGWTRPRSVSEAWGAFPDPPGWPVKAGDYGSYGINAWIGNPSEESELYVGPWTGVEKVHWRSQNVRKAATVPVFADSMWMEGWPIVQENPPSFSGETYIGDIDNSMQRFCILRHNKRINCLFLDYSVDNVGLKKLWSLKWHRLFDPDKGPQIWPDWMRNLP